jgi:hypothetical protein
LDRSAVFAELTRAQAAVLPKCGAVPAGKVFVTIAPSGAVSKIFFSTPVPPASEPCLRAVFGTLRVPPFDPPEMTVAFSYGT